MAYFWLLAVIILVILCWEKIKQFYVSIRKKKKEEKKKPKQKIKNTIVGALDILTFIERIFPDYDFTVESINHDTLYKFRVFRNKKKVFEFTIEKLNHTHVYEKFKHYIDKYEKEKYIRRTINGNNEFSVKD